MNDDRDNVGSLGGKPGTPTPEGGEDLLDRCANDRESLTPHETADCAGLELNEEYENEEDGGS